MFMGPFDMVKPWSTKGAEGIFRFLNRVWRLFHGKEGEHFQVDDTEPDLEQLKSLHRTIKKVEEGIENFAGCAVIISHDRWFLDRVCTHILAFENNSSVYWFEGSYSEYEENRKKRLGDTEPKRVRFKKLQID